MKPYQHLLFIVLGITGLTAYFQFTTIHKNTTDITSVSASADTLILEDLISYWDGDIMYFNSKVENLSKFTGDSIFYYYNHLFDLGEHNQMRFRRKQEFKDRIEPTTRYQYDLYHKGYLLSEKAAFFYIIDNKIKKGAVRIPSYVNIDTSVNVSKDEAIEFALKAIPAKVYAWDEPSWEEDAKSNGESFYPNPKLIITRKLGNNNFELIYKIDIYVMPWKKYIVELSPKTGAVIKVYQDISYCNICSSPSETNKSVNLHHYTLPALITLEACPEPNGIDFTYQLNQTLNKSINIITVPYNSPPPMGSQICWSSSNNNQNVLANTAYHGVEYCHKYFNQNGYNWTGINNGNMPYKIILNEGAGGAANTVSLNDFYINLEVDYNNHYNSWVTYDVIGHEITHGIDRYSAELRNNSAFTESLIILESICDIMGVVIENQKTGTTSWSLGEDITNGGEVRYFNNPTNSTILGVNNPQPSKYMGTNWSSNGANAFGYPPDSYHSHFNNGVMNHWFYLLATGGNGNNDGITYNISSPLSIQQASLLVFKTLTETLEDYSIKNFSETRKATLDAANNLFGGSCSTEWETVRQAWDAVGVYGDCELDVKTSVSGTNMIPCDCDITIDDICGGSGNYTVTWYQEIGTSWQEVGEEALQYNGDCDERYKAKIYDEVTKCEIEREFDCAGGSGSSTNPGQNPCDGYRFTPIQITSNINQLCRDGDIFLTVTGGIPPYSYQWSNGATTQDLQNVGAGTYYVTITDNPICNIEVGGPFVIQEDVPQVTLNNITTSCYSSATGAINISVTGGDLPYSFQWSNGATTQNLSPANGGTHSLTITDKSGCASYANFTVPTYPEILVNAVVEDECPNSDDGQISISVSGGLPPHTIQWTDGSTATTRTNLSHGFYGVSVTDGNNCTFTTYIQVEEIEPDEVLTEDCRYSDLICKGNIIDQIDHGVYYANDPIDCRYLNEYCNINNDLRTEHHSGPFSYLDFSSPNCEKDEVCSNGEVYYTYIGYKNKTYTSDATYNTPPTICFEEIECVYPQLNYQSESLGSPNPIGSPTSQLNPAGTACPSHLCQVDYKCKGQVVFSDCVPCAFVPPTDSLNNLSLNIRATQFNEVVVYPNPFSNRINLIIDSQKEEEITIKLLDLLGKEILINQKILTPGDNRIFLNLNKSIAEGVYLLKISNSNGIEYITKLLHTN